MRGFHLRTLREQRQLTQEDLKVKSGISQNQISKLENGTARNPAYSTVLALARALDVDVSMLRFGPAPGTTRRRRRGVAA